MQKLVHVMPTLRDKKRAVEISREIQQNISNYLFSVSLINIGVGLLVSGGLYFMGVPNAPMWGMLVAVLNFVPYFGPVAGVFMLGIVGLLTFDTLWQGLLPPAWYLLLHASGGGIYLEVAASVTTFLLAGRLYEAKARRDAGDAMRQLAAAGARDACVLADDGTERWVPVAELRVGQRFVVRPGERIAADGQVEFGQSAVDRSMMTGESVPVDAAAGDAVTGGTIASSRHTPASVSATRCEACVCSTQRADGSAA